MSGVTVEELMEFELENKIALPCNVILTTPTYGGIVSLGCHVSYNQDNIDPLYIIRKLPSATKLIFLS